MIRGAVYRIDLGRARGHEQSGRRFGVVVSPSRSPLTVVTVVPTSTSARAAIHRPETTIAGTHTRLLVDQIRSIDTDYVVGDPVDFVSGRDMKRLHQALVHYLGLDLVEHGFVGE